MPVRMDRSHRMLSVVVSEKVEIPARSEMIVRGKMLTATLSDEDLHIN